MADLEGSTYTADIAFVGEAAKMSATCGDCDWRGAAIECEEIEDCSLTPGDASPCGRCPECGTIAYLDRPIDRAREKAEQLLQIVRHFANPVMTSGNDTTRVDIARLKDDAAALIALIDQNKEIQ